LERRIVIKINNKRKAAGLEPMIYHSGISELARKHSGTMRKEFLKSGKRGYSHDGFRGRASKVFLDHSMSKCAENVAFIWGSKGDYAQLFTNNWMSSATHKKNILKDWNYTGVGVTVAPDGTVFATQLFALKTDYTF